MCPNTKYKPFIKWVGGKRQLLPEITKRLPQKALKSGRIGYAEPFVGGGAVLFHLLNEGLAGTHVVVNDLNEKLIVAYQTIRDNTDKLIVILKDFEKEYRARSMEEKKDYYLEQRAKINKGGLSNIEQTALLLFLNRTCFNGLYRENAKGHFNVPFGKNKNPQICSEELLYADAQALQKADLRCGDFVSTLDYVQGETLFYLDPPYKPISETSSFNTYTKTPFDDAEQVRLRDFCAEIDRRGHKFVLSNSDPGEGFFDKLYVGFRIERVKAKRCVNANASKRGALDELLISNF